MNQSKNVVSRGQIRVALFIILIILILKNIVSTTQRLKPVLF